MSKSENDLARENLGLVHACCRRFWGKGIEYEELYSAGCLGLAKAVSRSLRELSLKISRINNENRLKSGRDLTVSELSEALGTGEEMIAQALACSRPVVPLSETDGEGEERRVEIPSPDIQYEITERLTLYQAVESLGADDRKIIVLRYFKNRTQVQTARLMNMTQVQVSRREKKILLILRSRLS